ncbi:TetR/AcrR family transcriptional regulator [Actinophytocola oryzae]|uniref:TetR family transcriptional regulator n=1 Tax=Actinophytocola oryzae TaxID=502181 RepID=A0A4V3FTQ3_9PSEU|nr:TetR/AcrR family transcriptional regulator [Actinophytocola oryzae]TDV52221.1 TetR family transcriptional regulator [Actinophytocola oryzae]
MSTKVAEHKQVVRRRKIDQLSKIDKFAQRRAQLANSALRTLAELGYARTSLREIAQNSEFSHGVLHYYFRDKVDLITYCVRQYKATTITRYDQILTETDDVRERFVTGMSTSLTQDTDMHRLWYDLRGQTMFEESFRDDVRDIDHSIERMIGRIVSQCAERAGLRLAVPSGLVYALVDGVFQHALLGHLAGDERAAVEFPDQLGALLDRLLV